MPGDSGIVTFISTHSLESSQALESSGRRSPLPVPQGLTSLICASVGQPDTSGASRAANSQHNYQADAGDVHGNMRQVGEPAAAHSGIYRASSDSPLYKSVNYSSRLEHFAVHHWSTQQEAEVREEDVEAAADEPLLGQAPQHPKSVLGLPMLAPSSVVAECGTILALLTDMSYTAFAVPISIAFHTDLGLWSIMSTWDLLAGAIFFANVIQQLHTGIVVRYNLQRRVIMDGRIVAWIYLTEGGLPSDVLSTLPAVVQALSLFGVLGPPSGGLFRVLLALRWLRLLRLVLFLRAQFVASLLGRLGHRLLARRLPLTTVYLADILYCGMVLTNLLGMVWLYTAQHEGLKHSWLADVGGEDLSESRPVDQYFAAVLFAMATMSTAGYGDIRAKTTLERGIAMLIMLVGVLFFGFVISALGRLLEISSPEARRAELFRDKINKVDAWMSYRQLPDKLRTDITGYYANAYVPQTEIHEAKLFEELPAHLRGQVAANLLRDILESTGIWQALPDSERWRLAALLHPRTLLPGHDLCQEGEAARCLWLLQEGTLHAIKHAVQWEQLEAPALVGEEALLVRQGAECRVRPCTFRASGGCTLWTLVVSELQPLCRTFPKLQQALDCIMEHRQVEGSRPLLRSLDLPFCQRRPSEEEAERQSLEPAQPQQLQDQHQDGAPSDDSTATSAESN